MQLRTYLYSMSVQYCARILDARQTSGGITFQPGGLFLLFVFFVGQGSRKAGTAAFHHLAVSTGIHTQYRYYIV